MKKTTSGLISDIKRGSKPNYSDYLIYGKMLEVISKWINQKVEGYLIEAGIMIEKDKFKKFQRRLRRMSWGDAKRVVNLMKSKLPLLDRIIETRDIIKRYEEAQEFFAYFFLFAGYLDLFSNTFHEEVKKVGVSEKLFFDLITLDVESYTFEMVRDLNELGYEKAVKKHPFLKIFKEKIEIQHVDFNKRRTKRKTALAKLKRELDKKTFEEIKEKSDLINDIQFLLEAKNYYLDKIKGIMVDTIKKEGKEWICI